MSIQKAQMAPNFTGQTRRVAQANSPAKTVPPTQASRMSTGKSGIASRGSLCRPKSAAATARTPQAKMGDTDLKFSTIRFIMLCP